MYVPSLLRRFRARGRDSGGDVLSFADLRVELAAREVRRGRQALDLTPIEFRLLELFLRNPGRVLSRSEILLDVWGFDFGDSSNSLNVFVSTLRRKTEEGGAPRLLHTVRGVGYVLREPSRTGL